MAPGDGGISGGSAPRAVRPPAAPPRQVWVGGEVKGAGGSDVCVRLATFPLRLLVYKQEEYSSDIWVPWLRAYGRR